jgi:hypothetical protein
VRDARVVVVRQVDRITRHHPAQAAPECEPRDHVLVLPTPAVQAGVVAVDRDKVIATHQQQPRRVAQPGLAILFAVDDLEPPTVRGLDVQLVTERDHVAGLARVRLGLSDTGERGKDPGRLVYLPGERRDRGWLEQNVAVTEEQHRSPSRRRPNVLRRGLVEEGLPGDLDDADLVNVTSELLAQQRGRSGEAHHREVALSRARGRHEAR